MIEESDIPPIDTDRSVMRGHLRSIEIRDRIVEDEMSDMTQAERDRRYLLLYIKEMRLS